jgi:hypothetical protein
MINQEKINFFVGVSMLILVCAPVSAYAAGMGILPPDFCLEKPLFPGGRVCPLPNAQNPAPNPAETRVAVAPSRQDIVSAVVAANKNLNEMAASMDINASSGLQSMLRERILNSYNAAQEIQGVMGQVRALSGDLENKDTRNMKRIFYAAIRLQNDMRGLFEPSIKDGFKALIHMAEAKANEKSRPHGGIAAAEIAGEVGYLNSRRAYLEVDKELLALQNRMLEIAKTQGVEGPDSQYAQDLKFGIENTILQDGQEKKEFETKTGRLMKDASDGFQIQMNAIETQTVYDIAESR